MRKSYLVLLLLVIGFLLGVAGCAKKKVPIDVELAPFTDETFRISGVVPADWVKVQPGHYQRSDMENDPTAIIQMSGPQLNAEALALFWLSEIDVGIPPSSGSRKTAAFEWNLYSFEAEDEYLDETLAVAMALAEDEAGAYMVMLSTRPGEQDALYEAVFLPAVDAFDLANEAAGEAGRVEWEPLEAAHSGFESIAPADWIDLGSGVYTRDVFENSPVLMQTNVGNQSDQDLTPGMLAGFLSLEFAPPEISASYETEALNWNLYSFDARRWAEPRTVALAMAKSETGDYVILLHTPPDEYERLYDTVFLPIVDAFTPVSRPQTDKVSAGQSWIPFTDDRLNIQSTAPPGWGKFALGRYGERITVWIPDAFTDAVGSRDYIYAGFVDYKEAQLLDLIQLGPILVQGGEPGMSAQEFAETVMPEFGVELPQSSSVYTSTTLTWTLYVVEEKEEDQLPLVIDVALAGMDRGAYTVMLITLPEEYQLLHEEVFVPVLESFAVIKE